MQAPETIFIVDFGSQYTQLIARRIREMGVFTEVVSPQTSLSILQKGKGVILSGSAHGVCQMDPATFNLPQPILGISFGMQLMNIQNEGKVQNRGKGDYASQKICLSSKSQLFKGLKAQENVWMSHGASIDKLAQCYEPIAHSQEGIIAAIQHYEKPQFGIQFHPEVTHTENGLKILENFIEICSCKKDWTIDNQIERIKAEIKTQVGHRHIISLIRGGLDSAVATLLCAEALTPERVHPLLIDTGLMRENDLQEVCGLLRDRGMPHLRIIEASNEFISALERADANEDKKQIIDTLYMDILEREIARIDVADQSLFFCQGTIYTDSECRISNTILQKKKENGLIVEPNYQFFKHEVRQIAKALNLPYHLAQRHTTQNEGLALRIMGKFTQENLATLRQADAIFIEEIKNAGLYDQIEQAFAVYFSPNMIVLKATSSEDGIAYKIHPIPTELLSNIGARIVEEISAITYVNYDISKIHK